MLSELRDRHPVAVAIACAVLQFLVTLAILLIGKSLAPPEQFGKIKLVAFVSTLVVPIVLTQLLGLWRELSLQRFRVTPLFIASLAVCIPYLLLGLRVPDGTSIGGALSVQAVHEKVDELERALRRRAPSIKRVIG